MYCLWAAPSTIKYSRLSTQYKGKWWRLKKLNLLHIFLILPLGKKSNLCSGLDRPNGCRRLTLPEFVDNRHMKLTILSALRNARLYPPGNISSTHFWWRLSRPQGHNVAGKIKSMEKLHDTIGKRTRDVTECSAVPQPAAPLPLGWLLYSAGKNVTSPTTRTTYWYGSHF